MHVSGCKAMVDPDPACTDVSAQYEYGVCIGNTPIKCLGAYRLRSFSSGICPSGSTCVAGGCRS